jgi:hypothetical protein
MSPTEHKVARDLENPDPQELNTPIPRVFLILVAVLLAWAVYYIATQSPGLSSSSTSGPTQTAAVGTR